MRKSDISVELEHLRMVRSQTPSVASTPSAKSRGREPIVENIKKAKEAEFPTRPSKSMSAEMKAKPGRPPKDDVAPKKKALAPVKKMKSVTVEVTDSEGEY